MIVFDNELAVTDSWLLCEQCNQVLRIYIVFAVKSLTQLHFNVNAIKAEFM